MPTTARQKAEARKKQGHAWQLVCAVLMAMIPTMTPRSPIFIVVGLIVVFIPGIQAARYGYVDRPSTRTVWLILLGHAAILSLFGWFIWPVIKASPSELSFDGRKQKFTVSIKNEKSEDAYGIHVPFEVAPGLVDKLSATYVPLRRETPSINEKYQYCIGKDGKEYLLLVIPHLLAGETQSATIIYEGGSPFTATANRAISTSTAKGWSEDGGEINISENYKTCHISLAKESQNEGDK